MEFHAALSRCVWLTLLYIRANITSKGAAEGVWRGRVSPGWRVRRRLAASEKAERNARRSSKPSAQVLKSTLFQSTWWRITANKFIKGVENAAQKQAAMSRHVLRLTCLTLREKKKKLHIRCTAALSVWQFDYKFLLKVENTQRLNKFESYFRVTWPVMFVFAAIIHISHNCSDCFSP